MRPAASANSSPPTSSQWATRSYKRSGIGKVEFSPGKRNLECYKTEVADFHPISCSKSCDGQIYAYELLGIYLFVLNFRKIISSRKGQTTNCTTTDKAISEVTQTLKIVVFLEIRNIACSKRGEIESIFVNKKVYCKMLDHNSGKQLEIRYGCFVAPPGK